MRLKSRSLLLEGWEGEAKVSRDHAACSYGQAVLLVEGEPVGTLEAALRGYEILEATDEEREALKEGGYVFYGKD